MEEKEREQLKERLLKMVVNEPRLESMPPMTMAEVMVNSMSKPNLEPLLDFISQEIEKAREEGVKDGMRGMIDILCGKGCGSMFAVIEEKDVNKKIEELSKLKTK